MADITNKNKMYWRKKLSNIFKAFEVCREKVQGCEVLAMKIISLISLYPVLLNCVSSCFKQACVFYCKESLIFTYYNVKKYPIIFKSPIFSQIRVS